MGGIAPSIGGGGADTSLDEIRLLASGFLSESFSIQGCAGAFQAPGGTAATSGLQGSLIPLRTGMTVSKLIRFCGAAGASVTLSKMGLFDKTGKLLAATADNHALLAATSYQVYAIAKDGAGNAATKYVVPIDDAYYIGMLDLASGGTAPTFMKGTGQTGLGAVVASAPRPCFNVSAQSDITANVTPGDASTAFWVAAA